MLLFRGMREMLSGNTEEMRENQSEMEEDVVDDKDIS